MCAKSVKYIIQKFNKEFKGCIEKVSSQEECRTQEEKKTLNYLNLKSIMVAMGFMSDGAANSDSTERTLLYEMWKLLEGDHNEEVKADDLRILIMGILKVIDPKRVGVDSAPKEKPNTLGFKDDKHRLCLTTEDLA
mmetsp:Transcript_21788/g.20918  ORF Transcript_21788/g.20918 Transcript_21788/m.20918 type:complete len:136 (+) Transcript_21788:1052-1459(+)